MYLKFNTVDPQSDRRFTGDAAGLMNLAAGQSFFRLANSDRTPGRINPWPTLAPPMPYPQDQEDEKEWDDEDEGDIDDEDANDIEEWEEDDEEEWEDDEEEWDDEEDEEDEDEEEWEEDEEEWDEEDEDWEEEEDEEGGTDWDDRDWN
jgi:hypothetical protein